jgi:homocysteine S-methyltransferase
MKNELRVAVPDEILDRMSRAGNNDAARAEGVAIAREMLIAVKEMARGVQISAPFGRYNSAVDVLEALSSTRKATV